MNISSNESGMKKLDIDLIRYLFNAKSSSIEELEEHSSGMFSTQQKLKEVQGELMSFVLSHKNRNSLFYIFVKKEAEQYLKIVASTVKGEPDEFTKRYTIVIHDDFTYEIKQLSLSSQILTVIMERHE
jgi:hypothetical protein